MDTPIAHLFAPPLHGEPELASERIGRILACNDASIAEFSLRKIILKMSMTGASVTLLTLSILFALSKIV